MRITIRSGGQTGVDRAALDVALRMGLAYVGWCPRGGWAEDQPTAPGLLAIYPRLTETPSAVPEQRTAWNVRDSHATLIVVRSDDGVRDDNVPDSLARSPGTQLTRQLAELVFLRPCLLVDLSHSDSLALARRWLEQTYACIGCDELILNVAGPRESQAPGIYTEAYRFLSELLA